MRLNHLMLTVRNLAQSRDWYVSKLGLKIEFEVPDIKFAALEDDSGFGFLVCRKARSKPIRRQTSRSILRPRMSMSFIVGWSKSVSSSIIHHKRTCGDMDRN